jgi:hypothetical protein
MISFKTYMESDSEEEKNLRDTLDKLPLSHRNLVKGFSFQLQPGNTLKGDDEHIGYLDKGPKKIAVAAPWHYGREFTFLHEVAHRVWEKLDDSIRNQWKSVAGKAGDKEGVEEAFCMAYAAVYCKNPPVKYHHPEWIRFIKSLPS